MLKFLRVPGLILPLVSFLAACGGLPDEVVKPKRPTAVHEWQQYKTGAITVKGEFVLRKGESLDNGHIGIKIIDLYPAKYHLLDTPEFPKAKMQFFRVPDYTPICEGVFIRGSNGLDMPDLCKDRIEWSVIYIRDVNYDEGWVFFDLR